MSCQDGKQYDDKWYWSHGLLAESEKPFCNFLGGGVFGKMSYFGSFFDASTGMNEAIATDGTDPTLTILLQLAGLDK